MAHQSDPGEHPEPALLEKFMRNEAAPAERRRIVRHLIAGCSRCIGVTGRLWSLGDPPAADPLSEEPGARRSRRETLAGRDDLADLSAGNAGETLATLATLNIALPPPARLAEASARRRQAARSAAAHGDVSGRPGGAGRPVEAEQEQAPRLAAELLASPPAARVALLARLDSRGSPVCEALLERSREAAATEPGLALAAAELALAVADRLDPQLCGAAVGHGLRVRAWGHLAQARRLGDDLDGAEWALAVAEALASGVTGRPGGVAEPAIGAPAPAIPAVPKTPEAPEITGPGDREPAAAGVALEPAAWAELLVFKAGLFADRGDFGAAERLLARAAERFQAGAEPHRAGRTLVQQGLLRAEMGDRERAAEFLRAGVDLLDPAVEPGLVAANLYRLAALLRGMALTAAEMATPGTTLSAPEDPEASGAPQIPAPTPASAPAPAARAQARQALRALMEALQLVRRARVLYRGLGDAAADAHLARLQGQVEAALGKLEEAEASLFAATAALAQHGFGREAALAQMKLALVLVRQGRAAEVRRLGLDRWLFLQARDKSWEWYAAVLVFQCATAREPVHPAIFKALGAMLGELARYLAPRPPHAPLGSHDRRHRRRERLA